MFLLRLKCKHVALIILLVTLLSGLPSVPFFSSKTLATAYPEHITVTSGADPRTSVTITWQLDVCCCHIQYAESTGEHPNPYNVKVLTVEAPEGPAQDGLVHRYSATIQRLKPGTSYFYRVGYGNVWSEWRTFTTEE